MEWTSLAQIACGRIDLEQDIQVKILTKLGETITKFNNLLLECKEQPLTDRTRVNISFYSRNILESVNTALLSRFDPFRVMITYKVQSSSKYDVTKKSGVAIQWNGDILAKSKSKEDMWHPENKIDDYDRALLSNYRGELFWKPGFLKTMDFMQRNVYNSDWINMLQQLDETQFFEQVKTEEGKLFSAFSKGIHYEFLVNEESILDNATLQTYINRLFFILSSVSLVSHFINGLATSLNNKEECIQKYLRVEEELRNGSIR